MEGKPFGKVKQYKKFGLCNLRQETTKKENQQQKICLSIWIADRHLQSLKFPLKTASYPLKQSINID